MVPGYPRVIYGGDTTEDGLPIKVRNGRTAGGIVFEVPAGGTIHGRVITRSSEAAAYAMVHLARRVERGRLATVGAQTFAGADGAFTFTAVPSGEWFVGADERITERLIIDGVIPTGPASARTWYPSTHDESEAVPVTVSHASSVDGLLIQITRGPTRVITGVMHDEAGRPVNEAVLTTSQGESVWRGPHPGVRFIFHAFGPEPVLLEAVAERDGERLAGAMMLNPEMLPPGEVHLVLRPVGTVRRK